MRIINHGSVSTSILTLGNFFWIVRNVLSYITLLATESSHPGFIPNALIQDIGFLLFIPGLSTLAYLVAAKGAEIHCGTEPQ